MSDESILRTEDGGEITSISENSISWRDGAGTHHTGTFMGQHTEEHPKAVKGHLYETWSTTVYKIRTANGEIYNYRQTREADNRSGRHESRVRRDIRKAFR